MVAQQITYDAPVFGTQAAAARCCPSQLRFAVSPLDQSQSLLNHDIRQSIRHRRRRMVKPEGSTIFAVIFLCGAWRVRMLPLRANTSFIPAAAA